MVFHIAADHGNSAPTESGSSSNVDPRRAKALEKKRRDGSYEIIIPVIKIHFLKR